MFIYSLFTIAFLFFFFFFFSSRRRHTRWPRDWSSDVCSSDLVSLEPLGEALLGQRPLVAERDREIVDRLDRRPEGGARDDRHGDAQLLHLGEAEPGRHAGLIVEDRPLHLATDAADLLDARRSLHEREIGARVEIGVGASDRLIERAAAGATGIRTGNEDKIRVELAPHGVGGP